MSRESIMNQLKRNHSLQTDEIRRLKRNIGALNTVITSQKQEVAELNAHKKALANTFDDEINAQKAKHGELQRKISDHIMTKAECENQLYMCQKELQNLQDDDELKTAELTDLENLVKNKDSKLAATWADHKAKIEAKEREIIAHRQMVADANGKHSELSRKLTESEREKEWIKSDHKNSFDALQRKHNTLNDLHQDAKDHVNKLNQIIALHEQATDNYRGRIEGHEDSITRISSLLDAANGAHQTKDAKIAELLDSQLRLNAKVDEVMAILTNKEDSLSKLSKAHFNLQQDHATINASHSALQAQHSAVTEKLEAVSQAYFDKNDEFEKLMGIHGDHKELHASLQNSHTLLEENIVRKEAEIKAVEDAIIVHKDEHMHAKNLHKITQDEHAELKTMHDQLLGLFGAGSKEEFERALNTEIAKFETMIDEQEKENNAIQKDFDAMEKDFNVSRERNESLEAILEVRDRQMEHYESMAAEYSGLQEEHDVLKDEHKLVNNLHANEQKRADELHALHCLAGKERDELNSLADDIINGLENGDLTSEGRHELEVKVLKHISTLKDEIEDQETIVTQLEGDLKAEKKTVSKLEDDIDQLENLLRNHKEIITEHKLQNSLYEEKHDKVTRSHANVQKDLDRHKKELGKSRKSHANELQRADELQDALKITTKEHAALKDIHDTLLRDFEAGDAEQFKRDLNNKIGAFEKLIDEQEKELNLLKSQQVDEYEELNKDLQAILGQADMSDDIANLHDLNDMIEKDVLGSRSSYRY